MSTSLPTPQGKLWPKLKRGLLERCPNCGKAPLFRAYLKQVDACASCGAPWVEVRADDGPAWASMLVAGHLLAPLFHFSVIKNDWPVVWTIAGLSLIFTLACLWILPRMKGLFIALIWAKDAPTS